jgi:sirohydrochlorin cobaltochelatase
LLTVVFLLAVFFMVLGVAGVRAAGVEKKAVVLAVFGTSHESGLPGILNILTQVQKELPGIPVRLAFTSKIVRRIWQERRQDPAYSVQHPEVPGEILNVKGPLAAIADLQDEGYAYIVVQPTHISSGEEFADLAAYVQGLNSIKTVKKRNMPFKKILLGRPALGTHGIEHAYREDIEQVAALLAPDVEVAQKTGRALVYFAHGNEHYSTGAYMEFEQVMRRRYPGTRIHVAMVEGFPDKERLFEELTADKTSKVLLKPFMTVAGDHAKNDMAGPEPDSLKSLLEARGINVAVSLVGLGESDAFAAIFARHARDAMMDEGI